MRIRSADDLGELDRQENQKNVRVLYLDHAELSDWPQQIRSFKALEELSCKGNHFHAIPSWIADLTVLRRLDASENQIESLPAEMGSLTALKSLWLGNNALAAVPDVVGKLTALEELNLRKNALRTGLSVLTRLKHLKYLHLSHNPLSIADLVVLRRHLPDVRLDAGVNNALLSALATPANAKELRIGVWPDPADNCSKLPPEIGQLRSLEKLSAVNCGLSELPSELWTLSSLSELNLSANNLRELPSAIRRLKSLRALRLSDNDLEQIPDSIGSLERLEVLDLGGSANGRFNFLGELPDTICQLTALRELRLDGNPIHELPKCVGALVHLKLLRMTATGVSARERERIARALPYASVQFVAPDYGGD